MLVPLLKERLIEKNGTANMRNQATFVTVLLLGLLGSSTHAQDLNAARDDQINRLKNYVVAAIMPSGLVRDSLVLNGTSFHPATPDAAGFALLGLSALDHLDKLPDAEQRVINILNAYTGHTPGVVPTRSANGHFIHSMNVTNGAYLSPWDPSYTPIGTALLVAGAQFARNHFPGNATIASLTNELTNCVDFDAAIHPSLNGDIYLNVGAAGTGTGGAVHPWNEFMLVESLALRQSGNNDRALAVKNKWLNTATLPKKNNTLTDSANYAPAFWVQQMHFFNGDFRHSAEFETFFGNHKAVDKLFSSTVLGESFRYGITAGVSPQGYNADSISNHPNNVFSPEAVAAWGDMDTFLQFYNSQFPTTDPLYKYGLVRESATQPSWVPSDAGLVDHLFLLFGLVESIDANFFADRVFPQLIPGDFDFDGDVDGRDFLAWQRGDSFTGPLNAADLANWQANFGFPLLTAATTVVPEPATSGIMLGLAVGLLGLRRWR